jgi:hypothetical protein
MIEKLKLEITTKSLIDNDQPDMKHNGVTNAEDILHKA